MLPKNSRADKRTVEEIFKKGRIINSPCLTFKFIKIPVKEGKFSFIAPKSIIKLAVKRSFLRRKGYDALKKYVKHFPVGLAGVFIFKKYQNNIPVLENEIKKILDKIN